MWHDKFLNWYKFSTLISTKNILEDLNSYRGFTEVELKLKKNFCVPLNPLFTFSVDVVKTRWTVILSDIGFMFLYVLGLRKIRVGTWTSGLRLNSRGHCKPHGTLAFCQSHVWCHKVITGRSKNLTLEGPCIIFFAIYIYIYIYIYIPTRYTM